MKTYLQLLYKSFYDLEFVKNYIKNGKGIGTGLLALFALIVSIALTVSITITLNSALNGETFNEKMQEAFNQIPSIVIEDGELVWEDDIIQTYYFDKTIKMTIDTKNDTPSIKDIAGSAFYLTKTDLHVNNNGQIRTLSFGDIQKIFDQNPFELNSEQTKSAIINFVQYMFFVVIVVIFIAIFLATLLISIICRAMTRFFANKFNSKFLKDLNFEETVRCASVAIIPSSIIINICQAFTGQPGIFVKILTIVILGVILMAKYSPSNVEDIENADKTQKN